MQLHFPRSRSSGVPAEYRVPRSLSSLCVPGLWTRSFRQRHPVAWTFGTAAQFIDASTTLYITYVCICYILVTTSPRLYAHMSPRYFAGISVSSNGTIIHREYMHVNFYTLQHCSFLSWSFHNLYPNTPFRCSSEQPQFYTTSSYKYILRAFLQFIVEKLI